MIKKYSAVLLLIIILFIIIQLYVIIGMESDPVDKLDPFLSDNELFEFISWQKHISNSIIENQSLPYPLLFVHIAKTGGTTIIRSIQQSGIPFFHFWRAPDRNTGIETIENMEKINNNGILGGHVTWGMHRCWNPPLKEGEFTYFTVLREPISRVISHYRYHLNPKDTNHWRTNNITFIEWLNTVKFGKNAMTAYLSGIEYSAWWNENYFTLLPKTGDDKDFIVTEEHYLRARINLIKSIIGIQEDFSNSMYQFSYFFDLQLPEGRKDNIGIKEIFEPNDEEIEEIKKTNHWDIKLYEFALFLYSKQSELYKTLKN